MNGKSTITLVQASKPRNLNYNFVVFRIVNCTTGNWIYESETQDILGMHKYFLIHFNPFAIQNWKKKRLFCPRFILFL